VELINADATDSRVDDLAPNGQFFDAAVATYTLSLMEQWRSAWDLMQRLVRPGGRIAVVELGYPTGPAGLARPLARLACRLGGSEPEREPWRAVERDLVDLRSVDLWGGHVLVRVGARPAHGNRDPSGR
jgi:demethylmenaquinone methyltransferase/2-methoxy-6-polyprenyl-1,4-benzoquinol methylase